MYIGELAKRSGASARAIRLYESLGLLGQVQRQGSYRVYRDESVALVQMIRQALALGLRLAELAPVLNGDGEPDWDRLAALLAQKRASLRQEIARLERLDQELIRIEAEIRACTDLQQRSPACEPVRSRHQQKDASVLETP